MNDGVEDGTSAGGRSGEAPGAGPRRAPAVRAATSRRRAHRTRPAGARDSGRAERVPDVEEVEPLRRVLAHDVLEEGHPGAERRPPRRPRATTSGSTIVTVYRWSASSRQKAGTTGTPAARASRNGPSGNGAGRPKNGHEHVTAGAERPVALQRRRSRRAGAPPPARATRSGASAARSACRRRRAAPSARARGTSSAATTTWVRPRGARRPAGAPPAPSCRRGPSAR